MKTLGALVILGAVGVGGYILYKLVTNPKYQPGDVLTTETGYITIVGTGDGQYNYQSGIWPDVAGSMISVPYDDIDNNPVIFYYDHVLIASRVGEDYYDPAYYNRRTSTDDEGGVLYYDLIPVTGGEIGSQLC